jgi:hypothetical protein
MVLKNLLKKNTMPVYMLAKMETLPASSLGMRPKEVFIVLASSKNMTLEKIQVYDKPKSKWPYWLLCTEAKSGAWYIVNYKHRMLNLELKKDRISVVVERQWKKRRIQWFDRSLKKQYGILYKFLKEEDRLLFILKYQHQ